MLSDRILPGSVEPFNFRAAHFRHTTLQRLERLRRAAILTHPLLLPRPFPSRTKGAEADGVFRWQIKSLVAQTLP